MPLIDLKEAPSQSMQRWFGLSLAILVAFFGGMLWPSNRIAGGGLLSLAGLVLATYSLIPQSRMTIIRGWQYLTFPLAWTVGHVLLLMIYFGIFLPVGLIMRLSGHDPLQLNNTSDSSFWINRPERTSKPERYFRQF